MKMVYGATVGVLASVHVLVALSQCVALHGSTFWYCNLLVAVALAILGFGYAEMHGSAKKS